MAAACLFALPNAGAASQTRADDCGKAGHPLCPTTTVASTDAVCELSATSGQVGDAIVATVDNVPAGTQVQLRFDDETVASGVAPETGPTKLQGKVPDRPKGSYLVAAVGAGLELADCGTFGRVEVLGGGKTNDPPGRLALTGFQFWVLLLIAFALLVVGLFAMRASHHRRRHVSSRATA